MLKLVHSALDKLWVRGQEIARGKFVRARKPETRPSPVSCLVCSSAALRCIRISNLTELPKYVTVSRGCLYTR